MTKMNNILKVLLEGVYDEDSVLNCLMGKPHLVQKIWLLIKEFYLSHIKIGLEHSNIYDCEPEGVSLENEVDTFDVYYSSYVMYAFFPDPTDININMMPFTVAREFKDTLLPDYLSNYWSIIYDVIHRIDESSGKTFFLTINEGWVEPNTTQRRPGLHTDKPGSVNIKSGSAQVKEGAGDGYVTWYEHGWGRGHILCDWKKKGGIYMASTVDASCRVWNCKVDTEIIGTHGSLEHIREFLPGPGYLMTESEILWLTDSTPHESVPVAERTYRQFIRIVTEDVSLWFLDHSTPNPYGLLPNPNITKIVKGSKFNGEPLELIDTTQSLII